MWWYSLHHFRYRLNPFNYAKNGQSTITHIDHSNIPNTLFEWKLILVTITKSPITTRITNWIQKAIIQTVNFYYNDQPERSYIFIFISWCSPSLHTDRFELCVMNVLWYETNDNVQFSSIYACIVHSRSKIYNP